MTNFVVMRYPCIMEDEGRHSFEGVFNSKEDAEEYIKKEDNNGKGYFKRSDFYILEQLTKNKG